MDKQNKPQQTSEEEVTAAATAPSLQARSPYRPLSRRRRQDQVAEPPPAVERPAVSVAFDASPTTINAALAKAGAVPEQVVLVWKGGAAAGSGAGARGGPDTAPDIEIDADPDAQG